MSVWWLTDERNGWWSFVCGGGGGESWSFVCGRSVVERSLVCGGVVDDRAARWCVVSELLGMLLVATCGSGGVDVSVGHQYSGSSRDFPQGWSVSGYYSGRLGC